MNKDKVLKTSEPKHITHIQVNDITWRQFRLYCIANNITCYEQLNELLENFLKEKQFHVTTKGNQNTTSQID